MINSEWHQINSMSPMKTFDLHLHDSSYFQVDVLPKFHLNPCSIPNSSQPHSSKLPYFRTSFMLNDDPTQPYHMIQNINFVHYHNLGIEITDSHKTQNSSSHNRKSPGTQKPHHRIKRAFHTTLPWLLTTLTSQILPPGLGHFQVILILRVLPISLDPNPTLQNVCITTTL